MLRRVVLIQMLVLATSSTGLVAQKATLRVRAAAAGGFTGFKIAEVAQLPAFNCSAPGCAAAPDSVDLVRNSFYRWTPALSSGVIVSIGGESDESVGVGLGVHVVFAAEGDGTRPLPSATFHLGSAKFQGFFGLLFGASDEVRFPGEADRVRVKADAVPNFVVPRSGKGPNFFFGIVIGGASVVKTAL